MKPCKLSEERKGCSEGIILAIAFLKKQNRCTRNWYRNGNETVEKRLTTEENKCIIKLERGKDRRGEYDFGRNETD